MNEEYENKKIVKRISALEKIARISNFTDIDKLEEPLLNLYATQYGNELKLDIKSLKDLDANVLQETKTLSLKTEEDVLNFFKYYLKNLPNYDQIKGSVKGIGFILNTFGIRCFIKALWLKTETEKVYEPNFKTEDEIANFRGHFLTSYFDINIEEKEFETFEKNIKIIFSIINDIKPINKALDKIKFVLNENYVYIYPKYFESVKNVSNTQNIKLEIKAEGDEYLNNLIIKNENNVIIKIKIPYYYQYPSSLKINDLTLTNGYSFLKKFFTDIKKEFHIKINNKLFTLSSKEYDCSFMDDYLILTVKRNYTINEDISNISMEFKNEKGFEYIVSEKNLL